MWKWIIITAYVGTFFPVYLVGFGQTQIDDGIASIITTLTPISTLIVGVFFFNLFFTRKTNTWSCNWSCWKLSFIVSRFFNRGLKYFLRNFHNLNYC